MQLRLTRGPVSDRRFIHCTVLRPLSPAERHCVASTSNPESCGLDTAVSERLRALHQFAGQAGMY
jgi:hypothetical protein